MLILYICLQNAQHDIPKGTFLAILLSSIVYIAIAWMMGACILREVSGVLVLNAITGASNITVTNMTSLTTGGYVINYTSTVPSVNSIVSALDNVQNCALGPNGVCDRGLLHDTQVRLELPFLRKFKSVCNTMLSVTSMHSLVLKLLMYSTILQVDLGIL